MANKIIFFDLDGTLLNSEKQIPASAKQAIARLKEKGHTVAIATGRSPFMFKELRKELDIDTYVSFTGQYIVAGNKAIYKQPLPKKLFYTLRDYSHSCQHSLLYIGEETMKTSIEQHPSVQPCMDALALSYPEFGADYFEEQEIYQSMLFCEEKEEQPYQEKFSQLRFLRWHPKSVDILPFGGSKAKGIERLMHHLGFSQNDVYAFGDHFNDIEMLRFSPGSVAMGNAPEQVKRSAKYVTKDADKDGIAHGLELVGLLP